LQALNDFLAQWTRRPPGLGFHVVHPMNSHASPAAARRRCSAPRLFDMRPRLFRALDLSLQYQLSLWDCVYLALALERDCPVLTADRRLFRAGRGRHPSVRLAQ
jgi:predicted nucleic acid-binding protein